MWYLLVCLLIKRPVARQVSAYIVTSIVFTCLTDALNTITPTEQNNFRTGERIIIVMSSPIVLVVVFIFGKDLFYINIIINLLSVLIAVLIKKRCTKSSKSIQLIYSFHMKFFSWSD